MPRKRKSKFIYIFPLSVFSFPFILLLLQIGIGPVVQWIEFKIPVLTIAVRIRSGSQSKM